MTLLALPDLHRSSTRTLARLKECLNEVSGAWPIDDPQADHHLQNGPKIDTPEGFMGSKSEQNLTLMPNLLSDYMGYCLDRYILGSDRHTSPALTWRLCCCRGQALLALPDLHRSSTRTLARLKEYLNEVASGVPENSNRVEITCPPKWRSRL